MACGVWSMHQLVSASTCMRFCSVCVCVCVCVCRSSTDVHPDRQVVSGQGMIACSIGRVQARGWLAVSRVWGCGLLARLYARLGARTKSTQEETTTTSRVKVQKINSPCRTYERLESSTRIRAATPPRIVDERIEQHQVWPLSERNLALAQHLSQ